MKFVDLVFLVGQVRLSFGVWTKGVLSVFRMSCVKQIQVAWQESEYVVAREPLKLKVGKLIQTIYRVNLGHPKSPTSHIYRLR